MKKNFLKTYLSYGIGLILLALGVSLNVTSGLGISPPVIIAYSLSSFLFSFGTMTFILYSIFTLIEMYMVKKEEKLVTLLQIPFSIIFAQLINLFQKVFPFVNANLLIKLIILLVSILLTGFGAALILHAHIIPNPADGLVFTIATKNKIELGKSKIYFDLSNIIIALIIGFIVQKPFRGIGIGTILSMLFVGRVITFINSNILNKNNNSKTC